MSPIGRGNSLIVPALAMLAFITASSVSGQANAPQPPPQHKKSVHPKKPAVEPVPVAEVRPPDPPPPDWPANAKAQSAAVNWNGRELSISAANSSLEQILRDVSTATGLKVDGINGDQRGDQRIYGSFGPAPARIVLSNLLDGSGYNILMIGDQGEGTPRQLVLTAKTHRNGNAGQPGAQAGQNGDDEGQDEPEQPEQPEQPNMRRPMPVQPPGPGRSPQQFLQEMQQRHQQLQPDQVPQQPPQQQDPPLQQPGQPPQQ
jgi:hypothetical protein